MRFELIAQQNMFLNLYSSKELLLSMYPLFWHHCVFLTAGTAVFEMPCCWTPRHYMRKEFKLPTHISPVSALIQSDNFSILCLLHCV